mmetsp:Transcript_50635/g.107898  ORF Transcript_50635/g.107898 Transcript_50635/m.107898 type:complete len:331 (+) Transcript_50635:73-1065(+)
MGAQTMMRKANLFSSYAAAASIASNRIPCPSPRRTVAFVSSPSSGASNLAKCSRNYACRSGTESFLSNRIRARRFGSKSMNIRNKFFEGYGKSSRSNEDDVEYLAGEEEEEEEVDNSYTYQPANDVINLRTMDWIKRVVIGYNLCPFAERPLREDRLRVSVVRGDDDEHVAGAVVYELVARSHESRPGTTVVVAPEYHPGDFKRYISLVQFIEDGVMTEHDLHGIVQIAPFHPLFEFEGSGEEGIDNYTNRSPYPMFHILREDEVEAAVKKLDGDASKVWSRNVNLLEAMEKRWGRGGVKLAMKGEDLDGMDVLLKEIKVSERDENYLDR